MPFESRCDGRRPMRRIRRIFAAFLDQLSPAELIRNVPPCPAQAVAKPEPGCDPEEPGLPLQTAPPAHRPVPPRQAPPGGPFGRGPAVSLFTLGHICGRLDSARSDGAGGWPPRLRLRHQTISNRTAYGPAEATWARRWPSWRSPRQAGDPPARSLLCGP